MGKGSLTFLLSCSKCKRVKRGSQLEGFVVHGGRQEVKTFSLCQNWQSQKIFLVVKIAELHGGLPWPAFTILQSDLGILKSIESFVELARTRLHLCASRLSDGIFSKTSLI